MKRFVFYALLFLAFFFYAGSNQAGDKTASKPKVKLIISATPRQGFAPLTVTFHVVLEGVAEDDQNYYCLQEQWDFGDGAVSSDQPHCDPWGPDSKVTHEFFQDHLYQEEGIYSAQFILGKDMRSGKVGINVLENRSGSGAGSRGR
jgi:hypothetical protein